MLAVAQIIERLIVAQEVAGLSPVSHPIQGCSQVERLKTLTL